MSADLFRAWRTVLKDYYFFNSSYFLLGNVHMEMRVAYL